MGLSVCDGVFVDTDSEVFWQAFEAGDPRFDGWVFCGVKTTGIYCRPSCPARTPKRENVRFFPSAAAAQGRASARASAAGRTRRQGRRSGTCGRTWWDGRCG